MKTQIRVQSTSLIWVISSFLSSSTVVDIGWGEWGSRLRPSLFWGAILKNSTYSFESAADVCSETILSEDLFFFLENTLVLGEK